MSNDEKAKMLLQGDNYYAVEVLESIMNTYYVKAKNKEEAREKCIYGDFFREGYEGSDIDYTVTEIDLSEYED